MSLTERMLANSAAGFPDCEPGDHVWMGGGFFERGSPVCAVCLVLAEDLLTAESLRRGFDLLARAQGHPRGPLSDVQAPGWGITPDGGADALETNCADGVQQPEEEA